MDAQTSPEWDAIVVGGGAAGLSAALLLGRACRRVLVIDAGSPRNRFAAHMHGVLGNEGTPPADLLERGRAELTPYGVAMTPGMVDRVEDLPAGVRVVLEDGTTHAARALVVATGITDELPGIPGLSERWGASVLHCPYCHGWEVRGQRLGVLATSPTALHQVQLVRQWTEHITFFSAGVGDLDAAVIGRLRARGIEIVTAPVVEVVGDGDRVTAVRTDDRQLREVDAIFTAGAPRPHDGFPATLRLTRTDLRFGMGSFLAVDAAGTTGHDRVWAVGNVVNPMAKVPMVIGAGAFTGGAVDGALVQEEFDLAVAGVAGG